MKNTKEKWLQDLEQGEKGEMVIAKFLEKNGFKIIHYNKDIKYDLLVEKNGKQTKLEIKTDRYEFFKQRKTNNIFVEVECNSKKSGVMASEADWFIYYYPDFHEIYMISVENMKKLLKFGNRKTNSGDDGKVIGYTINRNEFKQNFKIVKVNKKIYEKLWK